jgi:hypothetical protein
MKIKFKYKDEMSKKKWNYQECDVASVDDCIRIYGLDGSDKTLINYEILEVDGVLTHDGVKDYFNKLKENPRISRVKFSKKLSSERLNALWYGRDILSFMVDNRFVVSKRAT